MSVAETPSNRWLYGPLTDLFLGCGLLYVVVSIAFAAKGGALFESIPIVAPALVVLLVSAPHYGATLLRVYDQRADRRNYFIFSIVATALIIALFGVSLFHHWTGSVLATVYLTWAGWHYTGQNYGISAMFLRRRGVDLDPLARRFLYFSFVLSYALVFLVLHGQAEPFADPRLTVVLIPLGIPELFNDWAIPSVAILYAAATTGWIVLLARRADRFVDLLPSLLIAGTQALWWSIPYAARHFDFGGDLVPVGWDSRVAFFPWIAGAHALQYLWITSFYARASGDWHGQVSYYGRIFAAGAAIWILPSIVFAPGSASFDWNFALLLAAAINIHHFVLDGAIWKLRHMKIASILIADTKDDSSPRDSGGLIRKAVWTVAILGAVLHGYSLIERYAVYPNAMASREHESARSSLERLSWFGKSNAFFHFQLGRRFEAQKNLQAARAQYEISAGMDPRVESLKRLIAIDYRMGNTSALIYSCDRLFELEEVPRPISTPGTDLQDESAIAAFQTACLAVVRAPKSKTPARAKDTGQSGQDGVVELPVPYD